MVRDITDLDANDLPDSLIKLYLRDGYYRVLDLEKRWPFLEKTFTFATVSGTRAYTVSAFTADPMDQIMSIMDNVGVGNNLEMVAYNELEQAYAGGSDTARPPEFYALWEGKIHLFPKPNDIRTLTVRGYREPIDWVTTGAAVDASANLHIALAYYACSRIYQRLEDTEMANEYKRSFDEAVTLAVKNIQIPTSHASLVLSGRSLGRTNDRWLKALGRNGTIQT